MQLLPCPFCASSSITYHKLIISDCVYCRDCGAKIELLGNDDKALNSWNTRASQWVSVKDRLPDDCDNYIIYTKYDYIEISSFLLSLKCFENNYVTHWQPLPSPPKEKIHE